MPNIPGTLDRSAYGASFGGPIKKNKLFFFTTYEGEKINENQQMTMIVPTASLRAGEMRYPSTTNGITQTVTLTPAQIATMDPNCTANGTCPWDRASIRMRSPCSSSIPAQRISAGDGLNTASYTWSAPAPASLNTTIAKIDYSLSNRNWLFIRGNLQDDSALGVPQFPGQPASSTNSGDSKGLAVGSTPPSRPT